MAEYKRDLNLDVPSPDNVANVLYLAATCYYESASDLQAAWGDENAGKVWERIAKVLERTATRVRTAVQSSGIACLAYKATFSD